MPYDKGCHTVFHHRYHLVWITKYRFEVLRGSIRERVREIIRQVCEEMGARLSMGFCQQITFICLCPFRLIMPVAMLCAKSRDVLRERYRWSTLTFASVIGDDISGRGAISVPQAGWSRMISYFSTLISTPPNLPTSVGSGLV